mmetsp:Transcript_10697/g.65971  ORF Transcript_10697/g.65971 Transcript_10697/m.65971 type:complete len:95 (+) Transcript_10697:1097-1381(+)
MHGREPTHASAMWPCSVQTEHPEACQRRGQAFQMPLLPDGVFGGQVPKKSTFETKITTLAKNTDGGRMHKTRACGCGPLMYYNHAFRTAVVLPP